MSRLSLVNIFSCARPGPTTEQAAQAVGAISAAVALKLIARQEFRSIPRPEAMRWGLASNPHGRPPRESRKVSEINELSTGVAG